MYFICCIIFPCCYWNFQLIHFAMGMLFCFVLFSNSGKRKKKKIRVPCSRQHGCSHLFFLSLPQALYRPKRLFSSRGGSAEGGKGSPLPSLHVSHCSSLVNVFPTHHLRPLRASSRRLVPWPPRHYSLFLHSPHLHFCFLFCFFPDCGCYKTIIPAIKVVENTCWNN